MRSASDTIAAIATPIGESGIGVIRVSGPAAIPIVTSIFKPAKAVDLASAPSHTCYFGTLEQIDQVVVTLFRSPHSYTGDDVVEISAHGSPFILEQVLQACVRQGARPAQPGEFTERAFLAGKMDLTQAEAVADLIRARTDQTHTAALSQLEGHLAARIRSLRDRLLPLLAHVEVGLDHSDEDHDFLSRQNLIQRCQEIQKEIETVLASAGLGKILRDGLRVALVGRPNVGKSSLLNALLQEERAIVTPIPGTTRDTLEESVNWEGIPVVLTDTAGVRDDSQDPVERLGMERTRKTLQRADLIVCIFDASQALTDEDQKLIEECEARPHIWVMNKIDIKEPVLSLTPALSHREREAGGRERLPSPAVYVSAKTGEGLEQLVHAVKRFSLGDHAVSSEARWMLNARHQAALERAREALAQAVAAASKQAYEECVALELHTALNALGEIIGETATEDLLGEIFSNFCVGK